MTVLEAPAAEVLPTRAHGRKRSAVIWLVVLALCGGLFGLAVASTLPASYVAEGTVVVAPLRGNAYQSAGGRTLTDLETESQMVSSDAVLRRVAADGGPAPVAAEIRDRLTVSVVPNATVLTLKYRGDTPEEARDMIQRLAAATLAERVERSKAAGAQRAEIIDRLIAGVDKDAERVVADAKAAGEEPSAARMRLVTQRRASLDAELAQALGDPGYPGRLITVVSRGDGGVRQAKVLLVGGSVLLAGLLGLWVGLSSRARTHAH